jgi:alpha-L-arabinofuranosidase
MKIIKTEGTKTSVGSFMIYDDEGNDICDENGNNAWDTYEEAERVLKGERRMNLIEKEVTLENDFDSNAIVNLANEHWNGWVNPYLTLEDSRRFLDYRVKNSEGEEVEEAKEEFKEITKKHSFIFNKTKYYYWGGCFIWSYK